MISLGHGIGILGLLIWDFGQVLSDRRWHVVKLGKLQPWRSQMFGPHCARGLSRAFAARQFGVGQAGPRSA